MIQLESEGTTTASFCSPGHQGILCCGPTPPLAKMWSKVVRLREEAKSASGMSGATPVIPVMDVRFDPTRRKGVDGSVLTGMVP